MKRNIVWFGLCVVVWFGFVSSKTAQAQVPRRFMRPCERSGQIVDPGCTAKLIRPMMPKNDYNTYWPVDADAPNLKVTVVSRDDASHETSHLAPRPKI